jgi:Chitobiase/beta-hexosaminidase C-terminal domain
VRTRLVLILFLCPRHWHQGLDYPFQGVYSAGHEGHRHRKSSAIPPGSRNRRRLAGRPTLGAPTFSPAGGNYKARQTVTISPSTAGATIRYTLDGTTPTETNGTVGTSVSISSSTTLKAIAYKSGMTDSTVTFANYTIGKMARPSPTGVGSRPAFLTVRSAPGRRRPNSPGFVEPSRPGTPRSSTI